LGFRDIRRAQAGENKAGENAGSDQGHAEPSVTKG
jgi:hypothetical protein